MVGASFLSCGREEEVVAGRAPCVLPVDGMGWVSGWVVEWVDG